MTHEDLMVPFIACSRNLVRLMLKFGLVSCQHGPNLIWSSFSENGTAADAFTEAPTLQSCITVGIEVILMCPRVCHNRIKEDSNLDLTGFQTHKMCCFQCCLFYCDTIQISHRQSCHFY